ncbi:BREX system P-loop protein BrxC [Deinococcus fonticola]|uniref:BREX system P-loop protein BrxC n=1 Tax=Deinococcus fonticola TaxID=2528713 RepID=UPI001074D9B7|nr:BREX system P-loop protein BrxC [Deinococcus fonticola]
MQNAELFARDPRHFNIPNSGVTMLSTPVNDAQWQVLKWELESFVCEGQYARGLERLLRTYLQRVGESDQPGWWISGFYGSGKSHLVRVLEHLWTNTRFPDGSLARDLVHLPADITNLLRELDAEGKREGGLWAASGTLGAGAGDAVRLAFASILFRAAGLPSQYQQARLVLWLMQKGVLENVRRVIDASNETWAFALENMYLSVPLATAIKDAVPGFSSESEVRTLFKEQFRQPSDLSDEEVLTVAEEVIALQSHKPGKLPCTLVILDEVQQFVAGADNRIDQVARLAESVTKRFGGKLLLVATGQSAMGATPQLSKIKDRFPMAVELSSADVDQVVRQVLLRKNPTHAGELNTLLDQASGEINRHLKDSPRLKRQASDDQILAADYPILPSRRRLWEEFIRSIDRVGGSGQLRSQLRITHEANQAVAGKVAGHVVGTDFVYQTLEANMLNTGALLPDLSTQIKKLALGNHGPLKERIAQVLFIISRLDPGLGVKATESVIADLLVENLNEGSSGLRAQLTGVLAELVESGQVMQHDNEYRLQTREGAEWEGAFRTAFNRFLGDEVAQLQKRDDQLKKAVEASFKRHLTFTQGESRTARKGEIYYSAPPTETTTIPIWVRRGWDETQPQVRQDALNVGNESPVVYVYLPEPDRQALKTQVSTLLAASEVLTMRPNPTTPGAREAQQAMQTRRNNAQAEVERLIAQMVGGARVIQGGGQEVDGNLSEALPRALNASTTRLYSQFKPGDQARWGTVLTQARQANASALDAINHSAEPVKHPVLQAVLSEIGSGKKGTDLRRKFTGVPYGWPQDAVDSALVMLTLLGNVTASVNGSEVTAKQLDAGTLGKADFRTVNEPLTKGQLLAVRGVYTDLGMKVDSGQESAMASTYVSRLKDKVQASGGDAPLPDRLEQGSLIHLQGLTGRELLRQIYEHKDALKELNAAAQSRIDLIKQRTEDWQKVQRLLKHNTDPALQSQADAIVSNRLLLDDPDPAVPLRNDVMNSLREKLNQAREQYVSRLEAGVGEVKSMPQWAEYPEDNRESLFLKHGLTGLDKPKVSSINEVIAALEQRNLTGWADATEAIAGRIQRVKEDVIRETAPKAEVIRPKGATLHSAEDVETYLDALKQEIMKSIAEGRPVVING